MQRSARVMHQVSIVVHGVNLPRNTQADMAGWFPEGLRENTRTSEAKSSMATCQHSCPSQ
jgi:hypothetical protein